ncbi:D-alanyl-D-alanine carboxypeptidase/D-alanyl-D-alanine endopeptidase [Phycisphaera mikurensis]|uniref:Putative D-alanyl-D-alanine carboxypeptidase n=1 Tax=Phycisphaera mikurensis (strain NBRC 102666 / KCTC 22515 / FYK2301M01) TaxID=1142394 RepID=I0IHP4_PHYMF|nr:D-alanyl-D-alanine carboxypeptidase/D-alanyl-D-alanine-endopeptidase [Phycisphaera mikurensis]MBB6441027.1 D-alanyl-D-alanine carboxypeptidase/D-alanyl-D-alanine-endopeptidase (penicillin-binding protein 4) [Phycisphaera mikurensis]BAM04782.1 putative D-alanyl-D-alanine carboxypeptidase [Phycisphaera mikurensis NBRC 102666]
MLRTPAALLATLFCLPAAADLEAEVREVLAAGGLGETVAAVCVARLTPAGPEVIVDLDADRPLTPASNMKLVTTAAALDRLGPDFAFETTLSVVPAAAPGGDPSLRVVGSGDPGFGDPELLREAGLDPEDLVDRWVEAVKQTGTRRFASLRVDDSIFDRQFVHPDWPEDQLNRWYCAEVAGLNFNDNCIDVLYAPGPRAGAPPVVKVFPLYPDLLAMSTNRARTGTEDAFWVSRAADRNAFTFRGSVKDRRKDPVYVTVHDPPLFFARYLAHKLDEAGVSVGEVVREPTAPGAASGSASEAIHRVRSTLAGVLDRTNRDSQNLFAETLLKRLGHEASGEPGSFANGAEAVRGFLGRAMPGLDLSGVVIADGSGLASTNRLTARLLVGVLAHAAEAEAPAAELYRRSLAELGESGTLRRRGEGVEASRVFAKTGYIARVSALSGYLVLPAAGRAGEGEEVYAFSMLFNGFRPPLSNRSVKRVQDAVLAVLDERLSAEPASR